MRRGFFGEWLGGLNADGYLLPVLVLVVIWLRTCSLPMVKCNILPLYKSSSALEIESIVITQAQQDAEDQGTA